MQFSSQRAYGAMLHLGISTAITGVAAAVLLSCWFPAPYTQASGGYKLTAVLGAINTLAAPLLTWLVLTPGKSRRALLFDLVVIVALQTSALAYGLYSAYMGRPVYLVFEYTRLALVHAAELPQGLLAQAPGRLSQLPTHGPELLSLRPMRDANEQFDSINVAMQGLAQAAQPSLWQAYGLARVAILQESKPLELLRTRSSRNAELVDAAAASTNVPWTHLRYLPLLSRGEAWSAIVDERKAAAPLAILPIDPFSGRLKNKLP